MNAEERLDLRDEVLGQVQMNLQSTEVSVTCVRSGDFVQYRWMWQPWGDGLHVCALLNPGCTAADVSYALLARALKKIDESVVLWQGRRVDLLSLLPGGKR